jgi:nicotinate-nucleotide--dimethylbenzimidazole phosphoribosyltransferase
VKGSLETTIASVRPPDGAASDEAGRILDAKTKPPGSLGGLETLVRRLAAIRGEVPQDQPRPAIVVAAADHGVWDEGVSPYPRSVTAEMLANFAAGGAAVCVLARQARARLVVVDAGVLGAGATPLDAVRSVVVDDVRGTANLSRGPAMSRQVAGARIESGIALAEELADDGIDLLGIGDMGIANTTAASALCAALLPAAPPAVCGPGTGLDPAGVVRKVEVVAAALEANGLDRGNRDPLAALAAVGGLEIAFLVGVILGAAARRVPILLDGFVTGAAALVATSLAPAVPEATIAATRSPEPGHALVLGRLGLEPLLDLGLRLGEGSGAALALPLVRSAIAIVREMATFEVAGVSRP